MANRYWNPAGAANWGDANVWALTDGGTADQATPTSSDDVFFTSTNVNNCTIAATADCNSLSFTGGTGYTGTLAGSAALNIYGSLTLNSGMGRTYTGAITFKATSTGKTITTNTRTMASAITFDGVGGGWSLADALNNGTRGITITNGAFSSNTQTITCGGFASSNSNTRTVTLDSSTVNCNAWTFTTTTGLTFSATSSTIKNLATNSPCNTGGLTYGAFELSTNGGDWQNFNGAPSFTTLTITTTTGSGGWKLGGNITVSGNLTITGASQNRYRILISSSAAGATRTITCNGTISLSNCDFQDITGAGSGTWSGTSIGDGGGNSGITFTEATTRYWVGNGGSWHETAHWSASDGGAGGATAPLCHDNVIFNAASFSSGSQTVDIGNDYLRLGKDITFTDVDSTPTLNFNNRFFVFGSFTLSANMTTSWTNNDKQFVARSNSTFTSAGHSIGSQLVFSPYGAKYTLQDSLTTTVALIHQSGELDFNDNDITCFSFTDSGSITRILRMGNGTISLTGISVVWNLANTTNLTVYGEGSTIKLTNNSTSAKLIYGGSYTYNNIWYSTGNTGILQTTNGANGNFTCNDFKIDAGQEFNPTAGTTITMATLTALGTSGSHITIHSSTSTDVTFVKSGGGVISGCDYVDMTDIVGSPANTWYIGSNSTAAGCTNIYTLNEPPATATGNFFAIL